ncbi:MAG: PAS domain S-box protein, partial [Chitinophagaceae bacterium]|nr:PAS domain S-box protein [Rubrivivax sp.]
MSAADDPAGHHVEAQAAALPSFIDRVLDFALLGLDAEGRIVGWNRGAQRILGHVAELMLGAGWERLFPPEAGAPGVAQRLLQAAQRDGETAVEGWFLGAHGQRRWCVGTLYRLPPPAAGFVLVSRDMTEPDEALKLLADSEARLALALDGARMGSWHWDLRSNRSRWNAREYELLGLPAGDGIADTGLFYRHVHPDDLPPLRRSIAEALENGQDFQHEFRVVVEGRTRWLAGAGRAHRDAEGQPVAMAGVNFDITEQRQAEQAVREGEARLQAVVGNASDAIVSTDSRGRIELFNPAAERIFGRSTGSVLGQPVDLLLPARARDGSCQPMVDFMRSGTHPRLPGTPEPTVSGRVDGLHADGRRLDLDASLSQAEVGGRTVSTAILRDVTERARADRALVQYQLELSGLAQHLLAQEKETTRRLAQSLHDELGQTLAALRLSFDALSSALGTDARPPQLQRVERLIADANRQVRRVLADLRPPLLDEQGLAPALDNELRLQGQAFEPVELVLEVAPELEPVRWPDNVEHAAFMIAREAIRNALQHAGAKSITVRLQGDPARLVVKVHDDGSGLADAQRPGRPGHLGLVGLRERALAIGAA